MVVKNNKPLQRKINPLNVPNHIFHLNVNLCAFIARKEQQSKVDTVNSIIENFIEGVNLWWTPRLGYLK